MADQRRPIPPNPPRWKPSQDPVSIQVPGLDTTASVHDQIEQMEQLITLKLQNIDENFSKIHHLLANKILPAVKRYAVATEPVREAAKFWTSFYEQAAQIKIPTFEDDYSTVNGESQQQEATLEATQEPTQDQPSIQSDASQSHIYEPSLPSTDESFIPGNAAISSTPAHARHTMRHMSETVEDPSWVDSSDLMTIPSDRDMSGSSVDNESIIQSKSSKVPATPSHLDESKDVSGQNTHEGKLRNTKGKKKSTDQPLLRRVLQPRDSSTIGVHVSPLKFRGKPKTPVPTKYNPFLPPGKSPSDWNGVVDLRDVSLTTPQRNTKGKTPLRNPTASSEEDESFDGLPPGMSPPVMMSPARPPRSMAELGLVTLSQTPRKEASAIIARDLVRDIQHASARTDRHGYMHSGFESSMSTLPTPPSFSRYHGGMSSTDSSAFDTSIESMLRRLDMKQPFSEAVASSSRLPPQSHQPNRMSEPSLNQLKTPQPRLSAHNQPITPIYSDTQLDIDSDMDSMDEINNTAHPSAAFLMASAAQGPIDSDEDSFGSSDHGDDSLDGESGVLAPNHPFAGSIEDDGLDDSFEDDMYNGFEDGTQEETVFGIPSNQRMRGQPSSSVRMSGEDLLQDTIGYGKQVPGSGQVPESPTPAVWSRD